MPRGTSLADEARLQGRLWTPAALQPSAWFDAADLSTINTEGTISVNQWKDKSGNQRHLVSDAIYKPLLLLSEKNGLTVVNFQDDATGARANMSASIQVKTAYVVVRREPKTNTSSKSNFIFTSNSGYDWHGANSGSYDALSIGQFSSLNWQLGSNYRNGELIPSMTSSGSFPLSEFHVFSFLCTGNMDTQGIGSDRAPGYYNQSVGKYAEILWFTSTHSALERCLTEGYLAWKWAIGLAASHPFRNRPPLIGD